MTGLSPNRKAKENQVGVLTETLKGVNAAIVGHCSGVTVESITAFRAKLRKEGAQFKVIKNNLAQIAIKGTSLEALSPSFKGPTSLAYTKSDPVALAKLLDEFAKENEKFKVIAGILDGSLLDQTQVKALADIPSKQVLLSRLVGSLQSPYAGLVHGLSGMLRKLVYALDAVRRQKEEQGK